MSKKLLFLLPIAMLALTGCPGPNNGGSSATPTSSEEEPEEVVIPTVLAGDLKDAYDAAAALAKGGDTGTTKYTFTAPVVAKSSRSFFVQKGYSGMYVYSSTDISGLAVGKYATVTASLCNYNGMLETKTLESAVIGESATLEDEIHLCGADQLGQLRQNIRVSARIKVSSVPTWSGSAHGWLEGKILNRDNEVADIKVKLDKYAYSGASAAAKDTLNGLAVGDVVEIHNLITTGYDATDGSTTCNQLLGGETITAVKEAAE